MTDAEAINDALIVIRKLENDKAELIAALEEVLTRCIPGGSNAYSKISTLL